MKASARVPKRFLVGALRLGLWVLRQRRHRELIPPERRERLEALPGWTWDPLDAVWEEGFACLTTYVDREGNARVPWSYREDGFNLGFWVGAQRRKRGSLAPDLRDRLEALPGWTWDEKETRWEEAFAAVAAYVEKVGHARVPHNYRVDGFTLGQWVSVQRRNRTSLSNERRNRLEALPGWVWDVADTKWSEGLAALTAYAQREGHARVPTFYREGDFELGQWVASQRQRLDQMPGDLRERLEAVPGWTWSPFDARWEEAFAALTAYVEREGHARVPSRHREGDFRLGQWVAIQRRGRLSRERRERLEALPGWTWDEKDTRWEEAFAALKAYVDREGHARVPTSTWKMVSGWDCKSAYQAEQQRAGADAAGTRDRLEALPGATGGWVEDSSGAGRARVKSRGARRSKRALDVLMGHSHSWAMERCGRTNGSGSSDGARGCERSRDEGRTDGLDTEGYRDEVLALFQAIWHLKDWMKSDPSFPRDDVEEGLRKLDAKSIQIAADVANSSLSIDRTPHADRSSQTSNDVTVMVGAGVKHSFYITDNRDSQDYEALELAELCLDEWKQYLITVNVPPPPGVADCAPGWGLRVGSPSHGWLTTQHHWPARRMGASDPGSSAGHA